MGTSCMQPTKERNHPSVFLGYPGEGILFDCGEGIQRQLKIAGIRITRINRLLISHWHGDHVLGIPGLINSLSVANYDRVLHLYGPEGSKTYLSNLLKGFELKEKIDFAVHEIKEGKFFENERLVLKSILLEHSLPCLGYLFIEKPKRRIDLSALKNFGLRPGPLLGALQRGLPVNFQGKKISPEEVTYLTKEKRIVYLMDTKLCQSAIDLAKEADLLICEATYKENLKDKAEERFHLTAKEAALIASQAKAKKLILTHFSPRYKDVKELEEEARNYFDNTFAAEDFMRIKI